MIGLLEEAERAYRRGAALHPSVGRALLLTGQARLSAGETERARRVLRAAAVCDPNDPEIAAVAARAEDYTRVLRAAGDAGAPDGLVARGTFRNTSGYAFMVRRFARCLLTRDVPLRLIDVPVSFLKPMGGDQLDPFLETLDRPVRSRAFLNLAIPTVAEPLPGLINVLFSMSETRLVPPDWLRFSLRHHALFVPTPSSARAWIDAGYPEDRVRICPLGVDPRPPAAGIAPMEVVDAQGRRLSDYRTRVANISDLTSRKNLDGLLRVWLRATDRNDDAALVLKLGKGDPAENARIRAFADAVARSIGASFADAAPIFLLSGRYSDDQMTSILAAATHYWSMSHGEGWDLPMTQAGAMGLTLIAPRHSAYTAYLDDRTALTLPARPSPSLPPQAGLEWWSPDEEEAAHILSEVVRNGLAPPSSARERLIAEFGWERAGDRLIEALREIGALA